jgi:N-acetylglutamate synthase-like GNAT family acetyltransferase
MKKYHINYVKPEAKDEIIIKDLLNLLGGDRSRFDIDKFVIAKDNEKIVGCIRVKNISNNCLELSSLVVLPEYRNNGIGSCLAREILKHEKHRPLFLLTSSDKELLYNRFGAEIVDPEELPPAFKKEYLRVANLPFAKDIKVIAMVFK